MAVAFLDFRGQEMNHIAIRKLSSFVFFNYYFLFNVMKVERLLCKLLSIVLE